LTNVKAVEVGGQAEIGAVVHDELDVGACVGTGALASLP
jgi:hypothetical protein